METALWETESMPETGRQSSKCVVNVSTRALNAQKVRAAGDKHHRPLGRIGLEGASEF